MKFENLKELLPSGIDVNDRSLVIPRNAINEFFLRAFLGFYDTIERYAVTFSAPYNSNALMLCDHDELEGMLTEMGLEYYYTNSLGVNQHFCKSLYNEAINSELFADALAKYSLNTLDVHGEIIYEGLPSHHYQILCEGDLITGNLLTTEVANRFKNNVNQLMSASERFSGIVLREADVVSAPYVGGTVTTSNRVIRITVETPTTAFYLQNTGTTAGSISFDYSVFTAIRQKYQYSKDGKTWTNLAKNTVISVAPGSKVYFKGTRTTWSTSYYMQFILSGTFSCGGQIASMVIDANWESLTDLTDYTAAFYRMFYNCPQLTNAPALPFTELSNSCYYNMFYNCTSITAAPYLPAQAGVASCYRQMFYGCTSLQEIRCNLVSGYGSNATTNWVKHLPEVGTFYKNPQASFWSNLSALNGIPSGWNISDL